MVRAFGAPVLVSGSESSTVAGRTEFGVVRPSGSNHGHAEAEERRTAATPWDRTFLAAKSLGGLMIGLEFVNCAAIASMYVGAVVVGHGIFML